MAGLEEIKNSVGLDEGDVVLGAIVMTKENKLNVVWTEIALKSMKDLASNLESVENVLRAQAEGDLRLTVHAVGPLTRS